MTPTPEGVNYPTERPNAMHFTVSDGTQRGIYQLNAAVNPSTAGYVYAKVYNKYGRRLSEDRLTKDSIRHVGWSDSGETFFPYNAEVIVYEGDWDNRYEARFEPWHKPELGDPSKVAETTRIICGWER